MPAIRCWLWVEWSGLVNAGRVRETEEEGVQLAARGGARYLPPEEVAAVLAPPNPTTEERRVVRRLATAGYSVENT